MPTVYRAMLADGEKPLVGSSNKALGVRVVPNLHPDIPVDSDGNVQPGTGGMSVAPAWRQLPFFLVPKRLKGHVPGATGNDNLICWRLGGGAFDAGPLTTNLTLRPDPDRPDQHGFVEPAKQMAVADYQHALAATREQWVRDEA